MRFRSHISTAVTVAAVLSGTASAQDFFGFDHTPFGAAVLTPEAGKLKISNLGSSGCDGFSIDLGSPYGWQCEVAMGESGALNTDAMTSLYLGNPDLVDWAHMGVDETGDGDAAISFGAAGTLTPTQITIVLLNGATEVDTRVYTAPYPAAIVTGPLGSVGAEPVGMGWRVRPVYNDIVFELCMAAPVIMTLDGSPLGPLDADKVRIELDGLPPGEPVERSLTLTVTAANLPAGELIVEDESILVPIYALGTIGVLDGNGYATCSIQGAATGEGVGDPDLCIQCPECPWSPDGENFGLKISNIGSSGCDGFSLDPRRPWRVDSFFDIMVECSPTDTPDDGDELRLEASGIVGGGTGSGLGSIWIRNVAGTIELHADYTPVGAGDITVEVYDHGVLQGSYPSPAAAGVLLGTLIPSVGGLNINKCGKLGGPLITPCFAVCAGSDFTLLGGGSVYVGNELRVLAEALPDPIDELTGFTMLGTNLDPITVAISSTDDCPSDLDVPPDGMVSVTDLLALLGAWGTAGTGAGIAPDVTVVNVVDLLEMLSNWGSCS